MRLLTRHAHLLSQNKLTGVTYAVGLSATIYLTPAVFIKSHLMTCFSPHNLLGKAIRPLRSITVLLNFYFGFFYSENCYDAEKK
jgi:hypothetical protein